MTFNPVLVWFLVGLVLIITEFIMPGIILVFFGAGAWITALTTWAGLTGGWTSQLLVWALSSLFLLILLRRRIQDQFGGHIGDSQDLDHDLDEFAGQIVPVTEDIQPGSKSGRVEFKGADWQAASAETIRAGSLAVVEKAEGITLKVRPYQESGDRAKETGS